MLGFGRAFAVLAVIGLVGGCALPRGAPLEREVIRRSDDPLAGFALYPVTRAFLPTLQSWPDAEGPHLDWIGASAGSTQRVIAPNDTVDIVIWDNDQNSLLLTPAQRQIEMRGMQVSSSGSIFLPYVGQVSVSGTTPEAARDRLQRALEPIAPSAQIQLSFSEGRQNSVELVAGVEDPGAYPLPDRSLTVLGLIALGGGVEREIRNPQVRLTRGGRLYGTSLDRLYAEPRLDTLLRPGDRVVVEEDDRYFLTLGASGNQRLINFPKDEVTALDAVSLTGGLDNRRADPGGILVLRDYRPEALGAGVRGPREQRVIFSVDLTSADGLFSAGAFRLASRDLVLITESPITNIAAAGGVAALILGITNQASNLGN
jgi:polysaccharide export outer membrane protein